MYRNCLACGRPFPGNDCLEHLGTGKRIAFDTAKGRLWLICSGCRRWSLVPIEARWEALEELERLVRDRSRLLAQTDNIALLRAGPLDIVRIGGAELAEEAWWRYGRELRDRRERYRKLSFAGTALAAGTVAGSFAVGGSSFVLAWLLWDRGPSFFTRRLTQGSRWLRFGRTVWSGDRRCDRCEGPIDALRYGERERLVLSPAGESLEVRVACSRCASALSLGGPSSRETPRGRPLPGVGLGRREGHRVLRRILAYQHFSGASERRLKAATRLIEVTGGVRQLPSKVLRGGRPLAQLGHTGSIALEIAACDHDERQLLAMEAKALEARWRREEELAAIIDRELTRVPLLGALHRTRTFTEVIKQNPSGD